MNVSGIFPPGRRVSIRKLADQLNVSTMPVKEALNKLHQKAFFILNGGVFLLASFHRNN
ncbi:GntR family transcriptional regulator [Cytobacillus kochii]|uniref:GntR family transcriptional regulator n=1 Tax=Cytobacillus kochii TaxID=859143 RepID=UPI00358DA3B0